MSCSSSNEDDEKKEEENNALLDAGDVLKDGSSKVMPGEGAGQKLFTQDHRL